MTTPLTREHWTSCTKSRGERTSTSSQREHSSDCVSLCTAFDRAADSGPFLHSTLSHNTHLLRLSSQRVALCSLRCHTLLPVISETSTVKLLTLPTGCVSAGIITRSPLSRCERSFGLSWRRCHADGAPVIAPALLESPRRQ